MLTLKHYRFLFYLFLLAIIGGMIFLYYQHHTAKPQTARQAMPHYKYPKKSSVRITGFQFDGTYDGKRVISIKADKFTIEKKKLGFIRFGLMNEAKFKNAIIDIYGKRKASVIVRPGTTGDKDRGSPQVDERSQPNVQLSQRISFKEVFTKEALPSFPAKRVSSILIEPVCINLHDEKSLVTRISAASARIRLKQRDILFKGNVRVISGSRVLKTDQLSLYPENAMIKTNRPFTLKTAEKEVGGNHLTTDIFLSSAMR